MNLHETVQSLNNRNITVAVHLGEHVYCNIDSNCPIAVELRKTISEAKITLPELLEGFAEINVAPLHQIQELPEINGKVQVNVAGRLIEVDISDLLSANAKQSVNNWLANLERKNSGLNQLGQSMYANYIQEMYRSRETQTLVQLSFPQEEMFHSGVVISGRQRQYKISFPFTYKPETYISRGARFKLSDEHILRITRQCFLQFVITSQGQFVNSLVFKEDGDKLSHYHGSDRDDCWGGVTIPPQWDRTLTSLIRLKNSIVGALGTINRDSMMNGNPPNMPTIEEIISSATRLGRQGETRAEPTPTIDENGLPTTEAPEAPNTEAMIRDMLAAQERQRLEEQEREVGRDLGEQMQRIREGVRQGWGRQRRDNG